MHRKSPLSVKVKAPSRGLNTRWPSSTADLTGQADMQRMCVLAENVRFEDGVMANAPGYERVMFTGLPLLTGLVSHWRFEEASLPSASGVRYDAYGTNHLRYELGEDVQTSSGKFGACISSSLSGVVGIPSYPSLSPGAGSFTVAGWIMLPAGDYDPSTWSVAKQVGEWDLNVTASLEASPVTIAFVVQKAAGGSDTVSTAVSLTRGVWHFVAVWRDTVGHTINVRVNAASTSAASSGALVAADPSHYFLACGTYDPTNFGGPLIIRASVDSLSYWNVKLSSGNLDSLYNSGTGLDYPFFTGGAFQFLYQAKVLRTPANPFYVANTQRLFTGGRAFLADPRQYTLSATEIYPGASGSAVAAATAELRWSGTDFIDKAVFVQASIAPQYHITGDARILPGLPTGSMFDGCESFFNHLLVWKDQTAQWCDTADLTTWIPVANTISSLRLTLIDAVLQPAINAEVTDNVTTSTWLPVTESPDGLTVGQYVRIDDTQGGLPYYNFYLVDAVSPFSGLTGLLMPVSGGNQSLTASQTKTIFLQTHVAWPVGQRLVVAGGAAVLTLADLDANSLVNFTVNDSVIATGVRNASNSFVVTIDNQNTGLSVGEYVSLGASLTPAQDIFKVTAVTVDSSGTKVTLLDMFLGSNRNILSYPRGTYIVRQPWVSLTNTTAGTVSCPAGSSLVESYAVKLKLVDLTGRTSTGTVIAAGKIVATLNANEAGSLIVIGGEDNGPIWKIVALGEYAHVFKNRSISSLQYVGRASGTFFNRAEIKNEGLIARNALVKLNDSRVVFLGNRELYDYQGGLNLKPVCQQFTRQMFAELDRTRLDNIVLHHREQRNEVWVVYPTIGSFRVLIWNYLEDTAAIDTYDASVGLLTAGTLADWINDPTWYVLADSLTWSNVDPTTTWNSYVGTGSERASVLASANGDLLIHGNVYLRNGLGYYCFAESMDYDMGDESMFKYVDSVQVSLQVKAPDSTQRTMYVSVGTRSNLDAAIVWSDPQPLVVSGDGQAMTKVNPGGSGRFIRLRFSSTAAGVAWRVAAFSVFCRAGGTY